MILPIVRSNTILALFLATLLGGCGTVHMQSFEHFSREATESTYRSDKQGCARHTDSADYLHCGERTDEAYEQLKNEREKAAKTR